MAAVREGVVTHQLQGGFQTVVVHGALRRREDAGVLQLHHQVLQDFLVVADVQLVAVVVDVGGGEAGYVVVDHLAAQLVAADRAVVGLAHSEPPARAQRDRKAMRSASTAE